MKSFISPFLFLVMIYSVCAEAIEVDGAAQDDLQVICPNCDIFKQNMLPDSLAVLDYFEKNFNNPFLRESLVRLKILRAVNLYFKSYKSPPCQLPNDVSSSGKIMAKMSSFEISGAREADMPKIIHFKIGKRDIYILNGEIGGKKKLIIISMIDHGPGQISYVDIDADGAGPYGGEGKKPASRAEENRGGKERDFSFNSRKYGLACSPSERAEIECFTTTQAPSEREINFAKIAFKIRPEEFNPSKASHSLLLNNGSRVKLEGGAGWDQAPTLFFGFRYSHKDCQLDALFKGPVDGILNGEINVQGTLSNSQLNGKIECLF